MNLLRLSSYEFKVVGLLELNVGRQPDSETRMILECSRMYQIAMDLVGRSVQSAQG